MKKLLGILVLGLLLTSCNQNRNDEYICSPISQGNYKDLSLEFFKDTVKYQITGDPQYTYDILVEKSDRIIFGYKSLDKLQAKQVFYKKTKKFKWDSSYEKKKYSFTIVYDCSKLN